MLFMRSFYFTSIQYGDSLIQYSDSLIQYGDSLIQYGDSLISEICLVCVCCALRCIVNDFPYIHSRTFTLEYVQYGTMQFVKN